MAAGRLPAGCRRAAPVIGDFDFSLLMREWRAAYHHPVRTWPAHGPVRATRRPAWVRSDRRCCRVLRLLAMPEYTRQAASCWRCASRAVGGTAGMGYGPGFPQPHSARSSMSYIVPAALRLVRAGAGLGLSIAIASRFCSIIASTRAAAWAAAACSRSCCRGGRTGVPA